MDSWVANLSDGSTRVEEWLPGHLSPWQRLMEYCKENHAYITAMRLTIGTETQACPSNARAYWQAHGMPAVQGIECDEELHKWRGIGWVENDVVQIIWGARDPATHDVVWWRDSRAAKGQAQIVWAAPAVPSLTVPKDNGVKSVRAFSDKLTAE